VTRAPRSIDKPRVGITIGDPAGIGPEIVLKAISQEDVRAACIPIIIGDATEVRRQAIELSLIADFPIVSDPEIKIDEPLIFDTHYLNQPVSWGTVSASSGKAAIAAIEAGVKLCLSGHIDAIATAPINKESLKLAGSLYPGHTEMLTALCGADRSLMCFVAKDLRVFLLTIHLSLAAAINKIKRDLVINAIKLVASELRRFGVDQPRIAIAGLNPHASEHGLFGNEEALEIEPAIADCRKIGIDVQGPFPADTIFLRAWKGEFDAVGACYHDQGLIAVKCLAFGEAVNVTLGLPIIRTSVDHGTAFDIAGRGIADPASMVQAIKLAAQYARQINEPRSHQSD